MQDLYEGISGSLQLSRVAFAEGEESETGRWIEAGPVGLYRIDHFKEKD